MQVAGGKTVRAFIGTGTPYGGVSPGYSHPGQLRSDSESRERGKEVWQNHDRY